MAFFSSRPPQSAVLNSTFINRLNSIFGFRTSNGNSTEIERKYGMKFVRVDLSNTAYKIKNAAIGSIYQDTKFTTNLEKYFDAYLNDNTISYNDIVDRQERLNELSYMYYNEPYISRVCKLVADEATQIDSQNRIICVESPNLSFVHRCYELFSIWGLTQQRIHGVCFDLELYGESFWAQKIGMKTGVSKITYVSPSDIMERLEFSPEKMAKYLAEKTGYMTANKNRSSKIDKLMKLLSSSDSFDDAENFADMFDTKLLGFELADGTVVPPWVVTHFRYDADHSEFFPYGRPPLLACLAPFKLLSSTEALQGLARAMSFPLILYKVKVAEGTSPGRAFELVEEVHEEYDNIGVVPSSAGSEVYTVNTKIWMPDGLLDIDIKENKVDIGSTEDMELYNKKLATAAGVPIGYIDPNEDFSGKSGIALIEQNKPFARHVYEVQSIFMQGLGELIRLHFAITGEYDYNTPFILSMRFPAKEMGEEQLSGRTSSMELTTSIFELLKTSLGLSDEDKLPQDVIEDILCKYTFLDPTDINKWMNQTAFALQSNEEEGDGDDMGDMGDMGDMDMDMRDDGDMSESISREELLKNKQLLQERKIYLKKLKEERLKKIRETYNSSKEDIYFKFLESNGYASSGTWQTKEDNAHRNLNFYVPKINENSKLFESFKVLTDNKSGGYGKLKERKSKKSIKESVEEMDEIKDKNFFVEKVSNDQIARAIERENLGTDDSISNEFVGPSN